MKREYDRNNIPHFLIEWGLHFVKEHKMPRANTMKSVIFLKTQLKRRIYNYVKALSPRHENQLNINEAPSSLNILMLQ
jgi:hypothetical protein